MEIREWVERQFAGQEPKTILDLGCNTGQDTQWLAALPGARVWAVDADIRNVQPLKERVGHLPNVRSYCPLAIADHDGTAELTMSDSYRDRPGWTESSSIKRPTGHLTLLPQISFYERTATISCLKLDTFVAREGIGDVALIWADLQGAEPDMILGGHATLTRTRYAYLEVPPTEEYAGQLPLGRILEMLPGWTVVERWPSDVLLANERWP